MSAWAPTILSLPRSKAMSSFVQKPMAALSYRWFRWRRRPNRRWTHLSPPGPVEPAESKRAPRGGGKPASPFYFARFSQSGARHVAGHPDLKAGLVPGKKLRPRYPIAEFEPADTLGREND